MLVSPDSRILMIRASAVGDVLNTLPAVDAIRSAYPRCLIGYLVDERSRDLIVGHPAIDQVHFLPRKHWASISKSPLKWATFAVEVRGFIAELRAVQYTISVDFQRNFKGGCLGLLAAAKTRIGLAPPLTMEWNHLLTHVQVKPPQEAVHFAEHFLAIARQLGASTDQVKFRLPESSESVARVEMFLKNTDLNRFAIIHPGTSNFGKLKRWPSERFAHLAMLIGQNLGVKSVIAWGPGEEALAASIVAASGGHAILSMRTSSLLDLAELLRRAAVFVGCDSGPMHIAGAVGTPSVALFGPKDPAVYGPYRHPKCKIVQPPGGIGPTIGISTESVFAATAETLET